VHVGIDAADVPGDDRTEQQATEAGRRIGRQYEVAE
jgi:hypothetical protein